jgi:hypothetical protein
MVGDCLLAVEGPGIGVFGGGGAGVWRGVFVKISID